MAITFNESGMNVQCNKRVSIHGYDRISAPYAEKLQQAAGVIERYAGANKEQVILGPVVKGYEDYLTISVVPDGKKRLLESTGVIHCSEGDVPFLRKVYSKIQSLTEGTSATRLDKMQAETIAKLKKIGKIK